MKFRDKAIKMIVSESKVGVLVHFFQVDWGVDNPKTVSFFVCCEVANLEYSFFFFWRALIWGGWVLMNAIGESLNTKNRKQKEKSFTLSPVSFIFLEHSMTV